MSLADEVLAKHKVWARVEKTETCWLWTGKQTYQGYGRVRHGSRTIQAHRFVYELVVGPIPPGLTLDHLCRVRHCVNPQHMEPVTQRENVLRGIGHTAQNFAKTSCHRRHLLDDGNVYVRLRNGSSERHCKQCKTAAQRAFKARRAALAEYDKGGQG